MKAIEMRRLRFIGEFIPMSALYVSAELMDSICGREVRELNSDERAEGTARKQERL